MPGTPLLSDDEPAPLPSEPTMRGAAEPRSARHVPGDDLLGRYTVLEELGQGGMGVVYKCLDREGGIEVAIKGLPPEVTRNRDELDEIRENYQIVAKLHHSAISGLRYLERDPASGDYYVVMDLAEGEDLSRVLRRRRGAPMPLSEALDILRPIASALDYAHDEGVLHRDVKPANVKVRPSAVPGGPPRVQLLDFGLAAQVRSSMSRVSLRGHAGMSGTPSYMAPEQWEARRQGPATDQYALAVVAYEMLSGAPPFAADDTDLLRRAVLSRDPDPVEEVPEAVNEVLFRALSKEQKDRFPSCTAFVQALERAGKGESAESSAGEQPCLAVSAQIDGKDVPGATLSVWGQTIELPANLQLDFGTDFGPGEASFVRSDGARFSGRFETVSVDWHGTKSFAISLVAVSASSGGASASGGKSSKPVPPARKSKSGPGAGLAVALVAVAVVVAAGAWFFAGVKRSPAAIPVQDSKEAKPPVSGVVASVPSVSDSSPGIDAESLRVETLVASARKKFAEGRKHLNAKRWTDAIDSFESARTLFREAGSDEEDEIRDRLAAAYYGLALQREADVPTGPAAGGSDAYREAESACRKARELGHPLAAALEQRLEDKVRTQPASSSASNTAASSTATQPAAAPVARPAAEKKTTARPKNPAVAALQKAVRTAMDNPTSNALDEVRKRWLAAPDPFKSDVRNDVICGICAAMLSQGRIADFQKAKGQIADYQAFVRETTVDCGSCGGSGSVSARCPSCKGTTTCSRCGGRGQLGGGKPIQGMMTTAARMICSACNGSGRCTNCDGGTTQVNCTACGGTGRKPDSHRSNEAARTHFSRVLQRCEQ